MSQLSGFDACKASLGHTNTLLDEIRKEFRLLNNRLDQLGYLSTPQAPPTAPLAAPPPASPPAHKPYTSTPPELPPQPISAPAPVPALAPARSYPPSPSVETIEEVEYKQVYKPLRNVKQMRRKLDAAKKVPTSETPSFEKCLGWSPKFGGIDMRFSRDEEPDAWYTTMLNATDALPYRT